jgi:hypothetical protein
MALSFWHVSHPIAPHMPAVPNDFLVLMVHLGGCFPLPPNRQPLNSAHVLIAPNQNFVKMLRDGKEVPRHLLCPPPQCAHPDLYMEWLEEPQPMSHTALLAQYESYLSVCSPSGRPEPMDTTQAFATDAAHQHTKAHAPNHPALALWENIHDWFTDPHTIAIPDSPPPTNGCPAVRQLTTMLDNLSDMYVSPPIRWHSAPPRLPHDTPPTLPTLPTTRDYQCPLGHAHPSTLSPSPRHGRQHPR